MGNSHHKRALIFGIGGQDGSYLADLLLSKGYEVHGVVRRSSSEPINLWRIQHVLDRVKLWSGDLLDPTSVYLNIDNIRPHEVFNEADQDHVTFSYGTPGYSVAITAGGPATILESVRRIDKGIKVFQPCSAMMFGATERLIQNEETPFAPQSPYACAKAQAYYLCRHYRREYGMHVSTAILYNHDSTRRTGDYLLHKVCRAAVRIAAGKEKQLALGCLDMHVDIGWAPEYMEAAWRIVQRDQPDDFILATGGGWRIRNVVEEAFRVAEVPGPLEDFVKVDPQFSRPGKQPCLVGDATKARDAFGFNPQKRIPELVEMLVKHYQEKEGVA